MQKRVLTLAWQTLATVLLAAIAVLAACVLGCALPLAQAPSAAIQQANPMTQTASPQVSVQGGPSAGPTTQAAAK